MCEYVRKHTLNRKDILGDPFNCYLPCIDKDVKRSSICFIQYSIAVEQILKGDYSPKEYVESIHVIGCQIGQQKEVT